MVASLACTTALWSANETQITDGPHPSDNGNSLYPILQLSHGGQVLKGRSAGVIEDHLGGHDRMVFCAKEC